MQPLRARDFSELAELAAEHTPLADYEQGVLALLERHVGFDYAFFRRNREYGSVARGADPQLLQQVQPLWPTIIAEGKPAEAACLAQRGVAVDVEVYGRRELERLTAHQRLSKPSGVQQVAFVLSHAQQSCVAALYLARRRPGFRAPELERLRAFAALIRLAEVARWAARRASAVAAPAFAAPCSGLSEREREVLSYLSLGYTNQQIASACGSSPHTVRNQLSHAYAKLGVASRAEAVAALLRQER